MQFYVINLARSPDRRAYMVAQLGETGVHYEIVNAIDVRDLDLGDARLVDPGFCASTPRPGEIGCALSHLEVYRKVLDDGVEVACVLEDDVILPPDLGALVDAVASQMTGAEVTLLNFHSQEPLRITRASMLQLPSSRRLVQVAEVGQAGSGGGYLITREACARMEKTARPAKSVADNWALFHSEGAIDRLRCVIPMPVVQSSDFRTTMNHFQLDSRRARFRDAIAGSRIPILRHALSRRRQRHHERYAVGRIEFV